MSALTTRMLVLGAVRIFGPANGYQLRRELLSWEVERWAHIKPGSIYSMLVDPRERRAPSSVTICPIRAGGPSRCI